MFGDAPMNQDWRAPQERNVSGDRICEIGYAPQLRNGENLWRLRSINIRVPTGPRS